MKSSWVEEKGRIIANSIDQSVKFWNCLLVVLGLVEIFHYGMNLQFELIQIFFLPLT